MIKTLSITLLLLLAGTLYCQAQIAHDLEIYSEDGLKFKLMANGKALNEAFESNVTLKNIEHDYLTILVYVEGEDEPILKKKYLQIGDPGTDNSPPVSCVYKIIKKKGKYKFRFVSRTEKKIQNKVIIIEN